MTENVFPNLRVRKQEREKKREGGKEREGGGREGREGGREGNTETKRDRQTEIVSKR